MPNLLGRTVKLFLVDGAADGMLTAEIMNWTGHVLYAPRSRIVELLQRPEAQRTGVYLLIGEDPDDADEILVYVGEGDNVGKRLATHNKDPDKEFCENICVITSKDMNLTKAHVRYLESRLIGLIRTEGRARLANGSEPQFDLLPEADKSDMEDFLAQLQMLLPLLRVEFIRPTPRVTGQQKGQTSAEDGVGVDPARATSTQIRPTVDGAKSPIFKFSSKDISATAVELDGRMVVLAGSDARAEEQPSLASNVRTYREQLKRSGKLVPAETPGLLRFTEDVAFTSPSAAAQAVMGTSRNGRSDWIVQDSGQTYAAWQESQIALTQNANSDSGLGAVVP